MDARFIVNHIKSEDQSGLDGLCSSARYFSATAAAAFPALNQKCLKRNYDQMNSPFSGLGQHQQQTMPPNDTCFPNSLPQQQQQQPPALLYRSPPYSIPFHGPEMSHLLVQEPKFPPQTFDIPDIQDLNSVFGGGGNDPFDPLPPPPFDGGGYPTGAMPHSSPFLSDHLRPPYGSSSFYGSPSPAGSGPDHHSQLFRTSLVVPAPGSFQAWLPSSSSSSSSGAAGAVVSSTGSANSSPVSQAEEAMPTSVAEAASSTSLQPLQVQSAKSNCFTTQSQSTISRLPNKKARSPKRRKRKDPNEPQKPVSAYSLFFRNAQAAIKSQNPSATFGDVSKIVASMWDGLDDEVKNFYKRQMEMAKKDYLKQLAIYRATLVSQDVHGKTGPDGETGISTHHSAPPLPPPAPSALPAQSPSSSSSSSSQKVEDGVGLGLSPNPAPLCMSASGYPSQNPLSPAAEPVNHHLMSPPSSASHPQTFPLFYSDGPPCLPMRYSSPSEITAMRNSFLTYNQKLDQESVLSRISDPNSYFHGIGPDAGFKSGGGEYVSLNAGNSFVNSLRRDIPGRTFVEPDENDQKLT